MIKNESWSNEELILALDFYFTFNPLHISVKNDNLFLLCNQINNVNKMRYNLGLTNDIVVRNPNAVYMKLCNYLRLDPSYSGKGLCKGSKSEEKTWNLFANDKDNLKKTAKSLVSLAASSTRVDIKNEMQDNDSQVSAEEGGILISIHKKFERNAKIVKMKKTMALKNAKKLACEICGFCFEEYYGNIGANFIECHHIVPLSNYENIKSTKLEDLILVCANCHRMLHRGISPLNPEELKKCLVNIDDRHNI